MNVTLTAPDIQPGDSLAAAADKPDIPAAQPVPAVPEARPDSRVEKQRAAAGDKPDSQAEKLKAAAGDRPDIPAVRPKAVAEDNSGIPAALKIVAGRTDNRKEVANMRGIRTAVAAASSRKVVERPASKPAPKKLFCPCLARHQAARAKHIRQVL